MIVSTRLLAVVSFFSLNISLLLVGSSHQLLSKVEDKKGFKISLKKQASCSHSYISKIQPKQSAHCKTVNCLSKTISCLLFYLCLFKWKKFTKPSLWGIKLSGFQKHMPLRKQLTWFTANSFFFFFFPFLTPLRSWDGLNWGRTPSILQEDTAVLQSSCVASKPHRNNTSNSFPQKTLGDIGMLCVI